MDKYIIKQLEFIKTNGYYLCDTFLNSYSIYYTINNRWRVAESKAGWLPTTSKSLPGAVRIAQAHWNEIIKQGLEKADTCELYYGGGFCRYLHDIIL